MNVNFLSAPPPTDDSYDIVVVGSGFGSSFFLYGILQKLPKSARVLVLERGGVFDHAWQVAHMRNSAVDHLGTIQIPRGHKTWNFTLAFGGGTNCWWANTPRMHPSDFRLYTTYGVGRDWPISYSELEPYYSEAETIMMVSGDPTMNRLFPRSGPFPQPPHRGSAVDRMMKASDPNHHFIMPTARARVSVPGRGVCCAYGTCSICPVDAKFTVQNGLEGVYADSRVAVLLDAEAVALETSAGAVDHILYQHAGGARRVRTSLCVLGANALFSPHILTVSNIIHGPTGRGLHEQVGFNVEVHLRGLSNFDGSTTTTGLNFALFDGEHRRTAGAAAVVFTNRWVYGLRTEFGRWRETLPLIIVVEDLPSDGNFVARLDAGGLPVVVHAETSEYARRGVRRAIDKLSDVLRPLPVEAIHLRGWRDTASHIQGTLRMGSDPAESVVDDRLVHHQYRNLLVVGTSVFPTCSCANPSLTAAALSLRAAHLL